MPELPQITFDWTGEDMDVISIRDFNKNKILELLKVAEFFDNLIRPEFPIIGVNESVDSMSNEEVINYMRSYMKYLLPRILTGKIFACLFFEASTRTRLSFLAAIKGLGGEAVGFSAASGSSAVKGETVFDTYKNIYGYKLVGFIMRHYIEGSARRAADAIDLPVVNAGDGSNEHPTQTLLDLYTILKELGTLEDIRIGIVGDLKYGRTVHSLVAAMTLFNPKIIILCSPPSLSLPQDYLDELDAKGITYRVTELIEDVISNVDILYMTRIQKERFPDELDYEKVKGVYKLNASILRNSNDKIKILHPDIIPENPEEGGQFETFRDFANSEVKFRIMHPLPRVDEIHPDVDDLPCAAYFRQAWNGIPVRQAILALVTGVMQKWLKK